MILSFGYLVLRQILRLIVLGMRGERSKDVEILVLRCACRHSLPCLIESVADRALGCVRLIEVDVLGVSSH
jgi:hypothetical protein